MSKKNECALESLPRYVGGVHPNCDYHHGQIMPLKGVQCTEIVRANRSNPALADGTDSTYKHAPCLVRFRGRFYVQYLCNPVDEHAGAGYSVLSSSADGVEWDDFRISFPPYAVKYAEEPDFTVTDYKGLTHTFTGEVWGFMHQRMSFYLCRSGRLLLSGFYGWSPEKWITNWDNYGIGRVVRELKADGSLGEIYFILPNSQSGIPAEKLRYPLYDTCPDEEFVADCRELLCHPLMVQQWAEENGDQIIKGLPVKHPPKGTYQAFCWYHRNEQEVLGLWKHSYAAVSRDGGKSFTEPVRVPSLVMTGQKVWAERTSDGRYAMVYDPTLETEHRYPLCVTFSEDGLNYNRMRLVHGQVPPRRYAGFWKDFGPQYMRGIPEDNREEHDDLYVVYSVNKEDIWIARIPIPAVDETGTVMDDFRKDGEKALRNWNLYSPKWAPARLADTSFGKALRLQDREPVDYCLAERMLKAQKRLSLKLTLALHWPQSGRIEEKDGAVKKDQLYLELSTADGRAGVRLLFGRDGWLRVRTVTELSAGRYPLDRPFTLELRADCETFLCTLTLDGEKLAGPSVDGGWSFCAAVNTLCRITLRTGPVRSWPTLETKPDETGDLPGEHESPLADGVCCDVYAAEEITPE